MPDWPPLLAGLARVAGTVATKPCPGTAGVGPMTGVVAWGPRVVGATATTSPRRCVERCAATCECSATMAMAWSDACSLGICGVCAAAIVGNVSATASQRSLLIIDVGPPPRSCRRA